MVTVITLKYDTQDTANWDSTFIIRLCRYSVTLSHNLMGNLHLCQSSFYLSARPLKYMLCHVTNPFNYPACICVCVLTDISRALRDGQIGASAPRSALVIPLTAATVRPSGVVFTLAAQLLFVIHTAVGMKVALAPVRKRGRVGVKRGQPRRHEWNFPVLQWKKQTASITLDNVAEGQHVLD